MLRKNNNVNGLLNGVIAIACIGLVLSFSGFCEVRAARTQAGSSHIVSGQVTDATTGWPLYASITISGTDFTSETIWTDPGTGNYSVSLPEGIDFNFSVAAWVEGYISSDLAVGQLTGDLPGENIGLSADNAACIAPGLISNGFAENFDSVTAPDLPAGWGAVVDYGTDANWATNAGTLNPSGFPANSGSNLVYFNSSSSSNRARGRLYRTAGINMTSLLLSRMLTFYMYHDLDYSTVNDRIEVQVSSDAGVTWNTVGPSISRYDGSSGWKQHSFDLSAYASQTDLRLGFLGISELVRDDHGIILSHGNDIHLDDIALGSPSCETQSGGLVVGTVTNGTTKAAMAGVTVSNGGIYSTTSTATGDPIVGDGFYTLFLPGGSYTLSAALSGDRYSTPTANVTIEPDTVVRQDFTLLSPSLSFAPTTLQATLPIGGMVTIPFTLTNNGGYHATFKLQEGSAGSSAALSASKVGAAKGHVTWLSRATAGIPMRSNQGDTLLAYPSAYRWTPDTASSANVLIYADDLGLSTGNKYLEQALQALDIAYTAYEDGDFLGHGSSDPGFISALANSKWDAVLYEGDNFPSISIDPGNSYNALAALYTYVQRGGKLGAEIWDMLNNNSDPLYSTLGVAYAGNYIDPTPEIHWWDATSPIFTNPDIVPEMPGYSCPARYSCGQYVDPVAGVSTTVAGYAATSTTGQAALILRNDGNTVFKAFSDRPNPGADANRDGIKDVVALWVNITDYLLYSNFPWLSESPTTGEIPAGGHQDVNITFDARAIKQTGQYNAGLFIFSNDLVNRYFAVPMTLTVNNASLFLPLIMK